MAMKHKSESVIIGGASAFIGDSILGPTQLMHVPGMQYLVFDYLAEMTLSGFSQARRGDPALGYAAEFVDYVLPQIAPTCAEKGIRLVANAGGLNPAACAAAIERHLREHNLFLRVAYVEGDDCMHLVESLRAQETPDFYTGEQMPASIDSANAYLGAVPIARALELGADIVVTGRIVDSAATLGILMHEFGWRADQFDLLAAGSLAGHVLECGAQATGGIFTDWERVPDWENIGYPFAICHPDGSFELSKPAGTGGLIDPMAVSEQVLYEVGDPAHYVLPDVVCDFTQVTVSAAGKDRIRVHGALGTPAPATYKLSASYQQGYRCTAQVCVFGVDAVRKARRTSDALLERTSHLLQARGYADFTKSAATVIGAEDAYGPHAQNHASLREAIARLSVTHPSKEALELFSRESRSPGVSFAPGTTSGSALTTNSRPVVEPLSRLYTCLVPKSALAAPAVILGGQRHGVSIRCDGAPPLPYVRSVDSEGMASPSCAAESSTLMLLQLAHGRSGDKGDTSNVAIFARDPQDYGFLKETLSAARVRAQLGHLVKGRINRYEVPGLHALNFVMDQALDGGGPSSLRNDPMGKGMAQMLLEMQIEVPGSRKENATLG